METLTRDYEGLFRWEKFYKKLSYFDWNNDCKQYVYFDKVNLNMPLKCVTTIKNMMFVPIEWIFL